MEHVGHSIDLGAAEPINEVLPAHIPSEIQADTLFTFMKEPEYLHTILMKDMISPRYCTEDILSICGSQFLSLSSNRVFIATPPFIKGCVFFAN